MYEDIFAEEIQIRDLGEKGKVIVLICPSEKSSEILADIIDSTEGKYKLKCYVNSASKELSLKLWLKNESFEGELIVNTSKNVNNYPPVSWLLSGSVKQITTGWLNDKQEMFHRPIKPLQSLILPHQLN